MRTRTGARGGVTLIEVVVAAAVMAIAALAVMAAVASSSQLKQSTQATEAANRVLEDRVELLRAETELDQLATELTASAPAPFAFAPTDAEIAPGGVYAGLPKGTAGTIEILDENETQVTFGLDDGTVDLDGDGAVDEVGLTTDSPPGDSSPTLYSILPLRLTLTWRTEAGKTLSQSVTTIVYPSDTTD